MKVSRVAGGVRHVAVPFDLEDGTKEEFHFAYRPGYLTLAMVEQMQAQMDSGTGGEAGGLARLLGPLLVSWDLEDDNGNPLPCNADALRHLPVLILGMIIGQMTEDMTVPPTRNGTSPVPSPQVESSDGSLTGTPTSV